ncbi:unnamed protein product [Laminaria digitata]
METQAIAILSASQASRYLDLSISTLAKWRHYGTGPRYSKLGRRVVYRVDELDSWVQQNQHTSTAEYDDSKLGVL